MEDWALALGLTSTHKAGACACDPGWSARLWGGLWPEDPVEDAYFFISCPLIKDRNLKTKPKKRKHQCCQGD